MKRIIAKNAAQPEKVGPLDIARALPNKTTNAVGPVIFLDHVPEKKFAPGELPEPDGSFAHPHRGIATFSYLLKGEIIHYDSNGGHGLVKAGGVQWMNAGKGIVHDEMIQSEMRNNGGDIYAFQFWVNLPARNKADKPDYMPVEANDLPIVSLDDGAATLKILLGEFQGARSPIPAFTEQFIWHINLHANSSIKLPTMSDHEYAGYLPVGDVIVNDTSVAAREFFLLDEIGTGISIENRSDDALDVVIFGGEPYREPMVSHGPFVMNTAEEINEAYEDFRGGSYGQINYEAHRV
jgi:redox-sensitive bicupin YhaK (pirin superfamily)